MNNGGNAPDKPGGNAPGGATSTNVTHGGATEFSEDTTASAKTFKSTTGGENAILVSGGTVNLLDVTVTKTGDEDSEDSDFYGTNAAIFAYNSSVLNITSGSVETNASHANGVFAYGNSKITISGTKITTKGNNSGGIMVTGGGMLVAKDLTVKTAGNSAAAIRSDRGGGTMTITGGTYESTGTGSPAIYSTADITVSEAELIATASEGVVIEGKNSVTLKNVKLTDTNNKLNGNSETYKNIFIYQSMSGDADEGVGSFTAKKSEIVTNKGDTFFVTNTTAKIVLANNTITNNDKSGALLRAQSGKWGTTGKNGGEVTMEWNDQAAEGDIILDNISSLKFSLSGKSHYRGAINSDNTAKSIEINVLENSVIVLTGDSYVTSLKNVDSSNSNIYANGHKLYVNGEEVKINQTSAVPDMVVLEEVTEVVVEDPRPAVPGWVWWTAGGVALAAVVAVIVVLVMRKKKKSGIPPEVPPIEPMPPVPPVPPVPPMQ